MSRARPIGGLWFDRKQSGTKATAEQIELLSASENIPLDDLLDEGLTQGEILERLRKALGQGVVPAEVLERRRAAKQLAEQETVCRICSMLGQECEGSITRHHFIPRWLMLQLENYQAYAARVRCTIPICLGRHRDLHLRGDTDTPKSIAQFLTDSEKKFAQKMLDELREQRSSIFDLIAGGDSGTYEAVLAADYQHGLFRKETAREVSSEQALERVG